MNTRIKKVRITDINKFAKEQWKIVNKKYCLLPPKKIFFFGVFSRNKLLAYAKIELRGGVMEIRDILVKNELTNNGIGSELIDYIEKWAIKNKCKKVVLKVPSVFIKTIKFYRNKRYKKDVVLSKYYYGHDWHYMSKDL